MPPFYDIDILRCITNHNVNRVKCYRSVLFLERREWTSSWWVLWYQQRKVGVSLVCDLLWPAMPQSIAFSHNVTETPLQDSRPSGCACVVTGPSPADLIHDKEDARLRKRKPNWITWESSVTYYISDIELYAIYAARCLFCLLFFPRGVSSFDSFGVLLACVCVFYLTF